MFSISMYFHAIKRQQPVSSLRIKQLEQTKELFESVVFVGCRWIPQKSHYTVGGRGVERSNHLIILSVVCCESVEVKLSLDMLEPQTLVNLRTVVLNIIIVALEFNFSLRYLLENLLISPGPMDNQ
ncbi:hypothetical protein CRENBAI_006315 [Crenichthys baileyi]|uniref:Uncharacterized protein n=1 Tax=Crenichthys baileyi TaxID=28760 RepID=A0AAV9RGJ5_9TELE